MKKINQNEKDHFAFTFLRKRIALKPQMYEMMICESFVLFIETIKLNMAKIIIKKNPSIKIQENISQKVNSNSLFYSVFFLSI